MHGVIPCSRGRRGLAGVGVGVGRAVLKLPCTKFDLEYKSGTKMIFAPPPDMSGHKIFAPRTGVDTTFSYLSDTPLHDIFRLGGAFKNTEESLSDTENSIYHSENLGRAGLEVRLAA